MPDLSVAGSRQPPTLLDRYPDLCTAHKLWMVSPMQMGIPFLCADADWEYNYFSSWHYLDPPTRLKHFHRPTTQYQGPEEVWDHAQTVALATLIEYAVATYGRERLPALLAGGLGRYESWATIIPAVYGVSSVELEAGWQAYLAVQYGVPRTRK